MGAPSVDLFENSTAAMDRLQQSLADVEEFVLLMGSDELLSAVESELAAIRDRGGLVVTLVGTTEGSDQLTFDPERASSLTRVWEAQYPLPTNAVMDDERGFVGGPGWIDDDRAGQHPLSFRHAMLHDDLVATILGNIWQRGTQTYVAPPTPLPVEHTNFYHTVVDATHYLTQDIDIQAEITVLGTTADEPDRYHVDDETLTAPVVSARQSFVAPTTNRFGGENNLLLGVDDHITVGGPGAFLEDYEATEVRLVRDE